MSRCEQHADRGIRTYEASKLTEITELERVPKKALKKADTCPICNNPFLDGKSHFL